MPLGDGSSTWGLASMRTGLRRRGLVPCRSAKRTDDLLLPQIPGDGNARSGPLRAAKRGAERVAREVVDEGVDEP